MISMNVWYLTIKLYEKDISFYAKTNCVKYDTAVTRAMKWCEKNNYDWCDIEATLKKFEIGGEYVIL